MYFAKSKCTGIVFAPTFIALSNPILLKVAVIKVLCKVNSFVVGETSISGNPRGA